MYQLSRLLHDYHRDLYSHLEQQEIGPSLYATPWFLTAFASHFPLGFVARVFGKSCVCVSVCTYKPQSLCWSIHCFMLNFTLFGVSKTERKLMYKKYIYLLGF